MRVGEAMSGIVLTVGPGHTLREVARLMSERKVGAAIVIDEQVPGPRILSERDILNSVARGDDLDTETVGGHARDRFISAVPEWSLERAATEMSQHRIRHLLVVESGELVGVLSMRDIVRCWMQVGATADVTSPAVERLAADDARG